MKKLLVLTLTLLLSACGNKDAELAQGPAIDSLVKSQTPVMTGDAIEVDSASGVLIDRSRMRSPEHNQTLARFEPKDIARIYREFRPLRQEQLKQTSLDSFLSTNKITLKELHTILSEGDQLGWNKVDAEGRPIK
jgi:hypothetical protein